MTAFIWSSLISQRKSYHWITTSTIGCEPGSITIFDSLHLKLSNLTKKVLADLLMTKKKTITVTYRNIQFQNCGSDCRLLGIAFVTSLCLGQDPATLLYIQPLIGNHNLSCIVAGEITDFPQQSIRRKTRKHEVDTKLIRVFCLCRLPDDGGLMIQCLQWDEWHHEARHAS